MGIRKPARSFSATLAVAAVAWAPATASADLYRCEDSDGRAVYTDNPAACPGSRPHQPKGAVQSLPFSTGRQPAAPEFPPAGPHPIATLREQAQESREAVWRERKRQKEEELRQLEAHSEQLREYVSWCNRGHELIREDEAGLRQKVSCESIRGEYESTESHLASVRAYLEEGIHEECRLAGCLPGWLR